MARAPRSRYKDVRESDWQEQVITAMRLNGWRVAHFRTALTRSGRYMTPVQADGAGFPDIFAVHPRSGDRLAVELKAEYEKPTPAQLEWLGALELAGIEAHVWRPSDVDEMIQRVTKPR